VELRLIIDTNAYTDFCSANTKVVSAIQRARSIFLPFIVLAELRAGFVCGTLAQQNEKSLARFLNSERVTLLFPDEQTTHHYARIYAQLRRQGTPIPINDLWIAALAVQHNMVLLSRDEHFDSIAQIPRVS